MGLLDGRTAVITGAGSGMGKASVEVFVREGANVIAADISGAQDEVAAGYGDVVRAVHCDVTDEEQVAAMMDAAVETFGSLDVVLNVAGVAAGGMVADLTQEQYDQIMDIDLRGVMFGMKHAIRRMTPNGSGSIINWSSVGGLNGSPGTSLYSAAKAGVINATKTTALECGPLGIRVNCICPGFVLSEIMGAMGAHNEVLHRKAALGRAGQPIEVAEVGAFIASDRASFLTGAVIPVDGGWSARLY